MPVREVQATSHITLAQRQLHVKAPIRLIDHLQEGASVEVGTVMNTIGLHLAKKKLWNNCLLRYQEDKSVPFI